MTSRQNHMFSHVFNQDRQVNELKVTFTVDNMRNLNLVRIEWYFDSKGDFVVEVIYPEQQMQDKSLR